MKNNLNLNLSVPKPCSEKWANFTPAKDGGFCSSCSKIVVDFTGMSDDEIVKFFTHKPEHACGRFRPDQLKEYSHRAPLKINPGLTLLKGGLLSLLVLLVSKQASAQNIVGKTKTETVRHPMHATVEKTNEPDQIIKGIVKSNEDNSPLPGVNITLNGSVDGTTSGADGRFEFPVKLREGDVLVFSFIGFGRQEYVVPKEAKATIEITMLYDDVMIMGAVAHNEVYTTKQSGFRRLWSKVKGLF